MRTIILDIGHGLDTKGKGVPELREYTFNQAVAKHAIELAKLNNINVILTQPFNSNDVPLPERTKIINNSGADLFISIHADYNENKNARGHWCFYWNDSDKSKRLAEVWNKNAKIILTNPNRGIVASQLDEWTNFHILRETKIPGILVEHGFMSNKQDLLLLLLDFFRKDCAKTIIKSVCEYMNIPYKERDDNLFTDVPEEHYSEESIYRLKKNGIMVGYEDNTFGFGKPLTREDFAVVIDRILQKQCWYKE